MGSCCGKLCCCICCRSRSQVKDRPVEKDSEIINDSNEVKEDGVKVNASQILNAHLLAESEVEELTSTCLKHHGKLCTEKWYTASLYPPNAPDDMVFKCCKREADFLKPLSHENVVKFVGVYLKPNGPIPVLVTEELNTNLLYHLDKVKTLQDSEKYGFSHGVSSALDYLHNQEIAHLNLYTKSIFLVEHQGGFVIKLANFEFACKFEDGAATLPTTTSDSFDICKFRDFRDDQSVFDFFPKAFYNHSYESIDIYSFGCVVFNLFTLERPTKNITTEDVKIPGCKIIENLIYKCLFEKNRKIKEIHEEIHKLKNEQAWVKQPDLTLADVHQAVDDTSQRAQLSVDTTDKVAQLNHQCVQTEEIPPQVPTIQEPTEQEQLKENEQQIAKLQDTIREMNETNLQLKKQLEEENLKMTETNLELKKQLEEEKLKNSAEVDMSQLVPPRHKIEMQDNATQTECKEILLLSDHRSETQLKQENSQLKLRIKQLEQENDKLSLSLTKLEEQSFSFTNAFTTAGEGSIIKLRDTYRNMQHNGRTAANRAHKKVYVGTSLPLLDHAMIAYEEAKKLAFQEFENHLHSYFMLKTQESSPSQSTPDKAMKQSMLLLESFHKKQSYGEIYKVLIEKYKELTNGASNGIPQSVEEYYSALAKFTWDCVTRPIPLIMSTDVKTFDKTVHEPKDGDDDEDDENEGKEIAYIYPVLFTSNNWPREVALRGKVKVL